MTEVTEHAHMHNLSFIRTLYLQGWGQQPRRATPGSRLGAVAESGPEKEGEMDTEDSDYRKIGSFRV